MTPLYIDLETYSEENLLAVGAYKYAEHPSTRITVVTWAYGDGPVQVWTEHDGTPLPKFTELCVTTGIVYAHNAEFERVLLNAAYVSLGLPPVVCQWRCTQVWAQSLSIPAGLGALAKELRVVEKLDEDKRLLKLFTRPPGGPDPAHPDWPRFVDYARRDTEVLRACVEKLNKYPIPESEWAAFAMDQRINSRGLPVDLGFAARAVEAVEVNRDRIYNIAAEVTGLDNPNSRDQMMGWLLDLEYEVEDLRADTVRELLGDSGIEAAVREALEARQQLALTSLGKFKALTRSASVDGRVRGTLKFYGAHTGRWSGRRLQPQNLPRGDFCSVREMGIARDAVAADPDLVGLLWSNAARALSGLIRSCIAAPPGQSLVVADYASIETVLTAWSCPRRGALWDVLTSGRDPYKDFGSALFRVPYDEITKAQRQVAKPAVIGGVYMLGAKGLQGYAQGYGVALLEEEAQAHVDALRGRYSELPEMWRDLKNAAFEATRDWTSVQVGPVTFRRDSKLFLWIDLPSGRSLAYYKPKLEMRMMPWGEPGLALTYVSDRYGRQSTHPGKLLENIIQAEARDVLLYGLHRIEEAGVEIVGHVHDEAISLAPTERAEDAERALHEAMTAPPWCADAPIKVESWIGPWYRKD